MIRILDESMRRIILSTKKNNSRVADENVAMSSLDEAATSLHPRGCNSGVSFLFGIVIAPFSLLSCLSHPRINGPDGVWLSAELPPQTSEATHLMVRDSLRYAILM